MRLCLASRRHSRGGVSWERRRRDSGGRDGGGAAAAQQQQQQQQAASSKRPGRAVEEARRGVTHLEHRRGCGRGVGVVGGLATWRRWPLVVDLVGGGWRRWEKWRWAGAGRPCRIAPTQPEPANDRPTGAAHACSSHAPPLPPPTLLYPSYASS